MQMRSGLNTEQPAAQRQRGGYLATPRSQQDGWQLYCRVVSGVVPGRGGDLENESEGEREPRELERFE